MPDRSIADLGFSAATSRSASARSAERLPIMLANIDDHWEAVHKNSSWEPFESYASLLHTAWLAVRTGGDPLQMANAVRDRLSAMDRDQAVSEVRNMETLLDLAMGQRRLTMGLLGVFAGIALLLACVGIYGITAYSATQRTHEAGIRRALGAQERDILRLVLVQSLTVTLRG